MRAVVNRMSRILIDQGIVDTKKIKSAVPNFDEMVQSLTSYTAETTQKGLLGFQMKCCHVLQIDLDAQQTGTFSLEMIYLTLGKVRIF